MSDSFLQIVSNVLSDLDGVKLDVTTAIISLIGISVLILGINFLKKAMYESYNSEKVDSQNDYGDREGEKY